MKAQSPIIVLENASKGWFLGSRRINVFNDVNLQVYPNQSLSIMGPSGSGKSTLLHILGLLLTLDSGSILFDGEPVDAHMRTSRWKMRQNIGIVFQDAKLLPNLTVLENVCLPLAHRSIWPSKQKKQAISALERVGLSDRMMHYPSQLSGGEMSRVAFARALVFKPKVLLADEPTGNLDSKTGRIISDLLMSVVDENHALVVVTHHDELAKRSDRILHIKDNTLVSI